MKSVNPKQISLHLSIIMFATIIFSHVAYSQEFPVGYPSIIRNLKSLNALDVREGNKDAGTKVWQYYFNSTDAQKFTFIPIPNDEENYYILMVNVQGLYLTLDKPIDITTTTNGSSKILSVLKEELFY